MSEIGYKNKFRVLDGNVEMFNPELFSSIIKGMEGKNGYMVIFDEDYQSDPAARKYYRGVMIRQAMKDEQFRGWEEHDLHKAVLDYAGEDSSKSRDEEWWSDFIRKAKDFFAEQDIHFPDKKHFAENTF